MSGLVIFALLKTEFSAALFYSRDFSDLEPKWSHGQRLLSVPGLSFREGFIFLQCIYQGLSYSHHFMYQPSSLGFLLYDRLAIIMAILLMRTTSWFTYLYGHVWSGELELARKKKNTRGGRLRIFSITGVFMGGWIPVFIYRLICLILRLMLKELILAFHFSFGFITRSPVTSVTSCLLISKLVWWSLFSFIPRCLLFFVSSSYTLEPCRRLCFLSGKIPWSTVLEDLLYPSSTDMQSCRVFW